MDTRLTEQERQLVDRWLRDTEESRPWHRDPAILALSEESGLVDDAVAYLRKLGHTVCELRAESIAPHAFGAKEFPESARNGILLVRELNKLPVASQQSVWGNWLNLAQPGSIPRFALSFLPFAGEGTTPEHDIWDKLSDLSVIVQRRSSNTHRTQIVFTFDPWRGGFSLRLSASPRERVLAAFDGLVSIHFSSQDRIVAIESFFGDHGGLPLRGVHQADNFPQGVFQVEGRELRVDPFQLRQSEERLELWFSTGNELPRDHWTEQRDVHSGVTVWLSQQKRKAGWPVPGIGGRAEVRMLAGLAVELCRTDLAFPITSMRLSAEDFK